jgi:hypothetical protein
MDHHCGHTWRDLDCSAAGSEGDWQVALLAGAPRVAGAGGGVPGIFPTGSGLLARVFAVPKTDRVGIGLD